MYSKIFLEFGQKPVGIIQEAYSLTRHVTENVVMFNDQWRKMDTTLTWSVLFILVRWRDIQESP